MNKGSIKIPQSFFRNIFVKNVAVIMSGTAIAQIISFSLTPIISRLFTPEDFGVLGYFNSILWIIAAGATLQYSQVIVFPKKDEDAMSVLFISCLSVLFISILALIVFLLFPDAIFKSFQPHTIRWIVWALPVAVFFNGMNQSLQAWCIRRQAFFNTSSAQVVRSCFSNSLQLITGYFRYAGAGLVGSMIVAEGMAGQTLAFQILRKDSGILRKFWKKFSPSQLWKLAAEYRDFPLYSAPQNVINSLSQGLPVLLLTYFFGLGTAGIYAFANRMLQVPMNFILGAFKQVFWQKASETLHNGGDLTPLHKKTTLTLFFVGILPSIILLIFAPLLFKWIFGEQWQEAGRYGQWLVLWLFAAFCNPPSQIVARLLRMQRFLLIYEIIVLFIRIAALLVGGYLGSALLTVALFTSVNALTNICLMIIIWYKLNRTSVSHVELDKRKKPI
jgi:O-antigen/teichoic acid export membrane protein